VCSPVPCRATCAQQPSWLSLCFFLDLTRCLTIIAPPAPLCLVICRVLQPWSAEAPAGDLAATSLDGDANGSWDQFAANEQLFGIKCVFNEALYTTVMDPAKSSCTLEEAERLAGEIDRAKKPRPADLQDLSEEERYSAVLPSGSGHTSGRTSGASTPRSATGSVVPGSRGGGGGRGGRRVVAKSRFGPARPR